MYALPPDLLASDELKVTGIACPECAGVLQVRREGHGNLRFICRVGHTMSVDELLTGKEERIEFDMWASVRALEELIALLEDLEAHARQHGRVQIGGPHDERIAQARDHVRRLRAILQEKRPVDLTIAGDAGRGNGQASTGSPGGSDG